MKNMHWLILSICLLYIHPTKSLLPPDDSSCSNQCFHQLPSECPSPENPCRCRQLTNCQKAAVCCNVNRFTLKEGLACDITAASQIQSLHIRNASFDSFNLSANQNVWRNLRYMTITDGHIKKIDGEFAKQNSISCLNLSSNHINSIEDRALNTLFNLSFLDLSHNNLTDVPSFRKDHTIFLDISNNMYLNCSILTNTLQSHPEIAFVNENQTFCYPTKDLDFGWFQSQATLAFSQVKAKYELEKNCHQNCSCKTVSVNLAPGKMAMFEVEMNCANMSFLNLPVPLPDNTVSLDVSNNNITSIKELSEPSYQNLRSFIADNNKISSVQPLEGTKFISHFNTLSLQRNKFKFLETYVLDNIQFERNFNQRKLRLGYNTLQCDCNTMKLKVWLLSKLSHIPDYNHIKCDNLNVRIIDLDASKMCQSPQDWTDYIYYIITAEVLLLVGLIAKVSYDYWVFKTAGYLPWPANRMPRLPCDWLCE
ncbi:protein halfway isoform X2 [Anthonomus grandis grandis]|uniref:protein halfway isoform X2 n=1 Tax=Anthonomus grandis grandis TaxID=2921223 RepID=UPI002166534F|nr:protein halfway isoform X2 [Anthonomus grandis grandis]